MLIHQFKNVQMAAEEDPRRFFARIDGMIKTLKSVGNMKEEREVTQCIIRNLSDGYDVDKRGVLLENVITRFEVDGIVRLRWSRAKTFRTQHVTASRSVGKSCFSISIR